MLRRTPCIGICSTTYGDLVCRGCKRFAHEIVQWNAFDEDQRATVRQRLLALRAGAVDSVLEITDEILLRRRAGRLGLDGNAVPDSQNLVYELLRRLESDEIEPGWLASAGVELRPGVVVADDAGPVPLLELIDREFYQRSLAQYERSFRIPAQ